MLVYLVRHAIAVPHDSPGVSGDAERELTPEGIRKMRRHVLALKKQRVKLDRVWSSPLIRARQTADLLVEGLKVAAGVELVREMAPGVDADRLFKLLDRHTHLTGVALVGHEPDMGELASLLLCGHRTAAIPFKKGAVACLDVADFKPPTRGQLLWLLTPRQMAAIA